jgi:hypothetical protein
LFPLLSSTAACMREDKRNKSADHSPKWTDVFLV